MVRRSFRIGLRLGLLAGVIVALAKLVQARRSAREEAFAPPPSDSAWPPLQPAPVTVEPPATTTVDERIPPVRRAPVEPPPPPDAPLRADPLRADPPRTDPLAASTPAAVQVPKPAKVVKKAAARKAAPAKVTGSPKATGSAKATGSTEPDPVRARVRKARRERSWVEPFGTDAPTSHPVKAKLSSMLYHLPGMAFYDRTRPDRCYVDSGAAEADGFIRAKR